LRDGKVQLRELLEESNTLQHTEEGHTVNFDTLERSLLEGEAHLGQGGHVDEQHLVTDWDVLYGVEL